MTDDALDVGQCPACGFPLDGPVVLTTPGARGKRLFVAVILIAALASGGAAGYFFLDHDGSPTPEQPPEFAAIPLPALPITHIAPFPHEPKQQSVNVSPKPVDPPGPGDKQPPVVIPKKEGPRPIGVVMKVDPKIAAVRNFDHPDDTAALPDLNTNDRVVLTGRLRALRIGSVNGKGSVDASGLIVEEIVITGDLNNEAVLNLNAPNGKVTLGGFVYGSSKVTITAPGGEVVVAKSSRATGGAVLTVTAKRLEANGPLSGAAKVHMTLTAGGTIKYTLMEDGAIITYKKAAPNDPAPSIERGLTRGGARIVEAK
jgi:hypothetical protein